MHLGRDDVARTDEQAYGEPLQLTVTEAADELRIGRTLAYQLARRYLASNEREGVPMQGVIDAVVPSELDYGPGQTRILDVVRSTHFHAAAPRNVAGAGHRRVDHQRTCARPLAPIRLVTAPLRRGPHMATCRGRPDTGSHPASAVSSHLPGDPTTKGL